MAGDKTVIGALYDEINKMFSRYKNKIAADCMSRPIGQRTKCKDEYRIMAYKKAIPIVKRHMSQCKKDIWNGEEKCRKKLVKTIRTYEKKIKTHQRSYRQLSALTPAKRAHMNSKTIDPITAIILEGNKNDKISKD